MAQLTIPHRWLGREIRIALIGCGGSGSEMLDELYRIHSLLTALDGEGIHVTAFDPDEVSRANIGRQRFWPCDVGFPKAEVLINRVNSFGGVNWSFCNDAFDIHRSHIQYDILITCVDRPSVRAEIGASAAPDSEFGIGMRPDMFWLDCGNDASTGNVILGHLGESSGQMRIPNVYDLYPMLAEMEDGKEPSCSTAAALENQDYGINRSVAREAANLLWQLLRHGALDHHGSYIDIKQGTVTPLRIDPALWSTFAQAG